MTTPAKLYGKDLSEYDDVDVDALLAQLSPEEINILAKEVDPDVSLLILPMRKLFNFVLFRIHFYHQTNVLVTIVKKTQQDR